MTLNTVRLGEGARGVRAAAAILARGGLVAFPTETVYGLGADARDERAVASIYRAKGRPSHNPLIVHVADAGAAAALVELGEAGEAAAALWPGPLTLVAPMREGARIAAPVRAGHDTLAVRVPSHPLARRLLEAANAPLAAPSANRSGRVSPTTATHVLEELHGRIDAVLDGGACPVGLESTIMKVGDGSPVLLRPGGVPVETLEAALGPIARPESDSDDAPQAPGRLASHYAPSAALRLEAGAPRLGEAWLGFGPSPHEGWALSANLSPSGDVAEAAANLFAMLRALDAGLGGSGTIAVAPVPDAGLGEAVNDRLRRAAAPR